jgi:beta-glucosidase
MKLTAVAALSLTVCTAIAQAIPEAQVRSRAEALLSRMTPEEKVGQLSQMFYGVIPGMKISDDLIRQGKIGSFLMITDPVLANRLQHVAVEQSRLHIPLLYGFDVIHGFHTIFPVPLAMAASWDPALIERVQQRAAREASAVGVRWTFAPMVDIARDPRWGRIVEGAGEDPYLGSKVAAAQVRGFQGPYAGAPDHLLACVKHFAAYGAADGGRDYDSSWVPEDQMWNVYLPPFHAAVEAGSASLMSAYMDLNGVPATGNPFLLQDVLRKAWKFEGFVVSDAFAVRDLQTHGFAATPEDAAFRAFTAGVDMDMGSMTYARQLPALLQSGKISMRELDDAVRRLLEAKIRLGLFEHPYVEESRVAAVFDLASTRELAREAAARDAVLLRNEGNVLPLAKTIQRVAVIGPLGDTNDLLGPWSLANARAHAVTVIEGIREKLGANAHVEAAPGVQIFRRYPSFFDMLLGTKPEPKWDAERAKAEFSRAVELARNSDAVVLALGEKQQMSGEAASRSSIDLPGEQEQLLEAVASTGKPIVLVLINGRPLNLTGAAAHVPAIVETWYPGVEGGNAIADVLFGDVNPGGKLPVTFPRSTGQIPIYYAHNLTHQPETAAGFTSRYWDEPSTPLYPFGYGLSYTRFAFSNLRLSAPSVARGGKITISVDVENTGQRAGDEVVQLYLHQCWGGASRPVRELKGFRRLTLAAGQKRTVQFEIGADERKYWNPAKRGWVEDSSKFDVWAGGDSTAPLHTTFEVTD